MRKWPDDFVGKIINADCMDVMREMPDKCVDLVLADPPYGINYGKLLKGKGDGLGGADKNGWKDYGCPQWDVERPTKDYFLEIIRVSKNQIIWGGELFCGFIITKHGMVGMG